VNSRYAVAKWIAGSFDRRLFRALSKTDAVIASADSDAIDGLVARSKGSLQREKITFQPTVINTTIFKPGSAVSGATAARSSGTRANCVVLRPAQLGERVGSGPLGVCTLVDG